MSTYRISKILQEFESLDEKSKKELFQKLLNQNSDMILESITGTAGLESNTINFAPMNSGRCRLCGK
ncbi:hypothetical protein [Vibrio parahaemolyticus]|uniref:hypothetical protein n=1 Tax=Vibrio parahaemolyticus TaxID=670 RepID=UPI00044687FD|nr:hypothetical protein [Vibrio parahaemolyticus]EGQ7830879.1 hypothetical protein [Vibrio parahaemolyticus]EGQ9828819.1 hypothetical protein [Vibrio parahaemolyticus]EGR0257691.1 hypothetical protein [Vibrio parahaemolyticus]EHH1256183.1 hypothetical protein [Vibrio parahaemolyticus]EHR6658985.1 hypothetical protein [Vibrio parahaemolyticus]